MRIYDIIESKRFGKVLSRDEIYYFVEGYAKGDIPDYQISALLMAIVINGMNLEETKFLTEAIIDSGHVFDLSGIKGIKVDKHSTGGVGDKTTLVLGPMLAASGLVLAKMSGRGLGHTGGTLDKLESIPGFKVDISMKEFVEYCNSDHIAVCAQTKDVTPADKKLYALRDATATVENYSLIASSIMGKKLAMGADYIVLDVKVGSGAFMKDKESAEKLARVMVDLGNAFNRKTAAVISNMNQPLGYAVGNSLEVIEAINALKGEGPGDLIKLCLKLGSKLLMLSGICSNEAEAVEKLNKSIETKSALAKLKAMVSNQCGDVEYIDNTNLFKLSGTGVKVFSEREGFIHSIDALEIGKMAMELGAGRKTKEDDIDLGAGILLNKKSGDKVKKGELLATLFSLKEDELRAASDKILKIIKVESSNKEPDNLILEEVE